MKLAASIIGYIAIAVSVLIYQQNTRKKLLICKGLSDVLWISHYILLSAYTGAAVTAVAMLRTLVFLNKDAKDPKNRKWLFVFLGISIISGILTWNGFFSIFAMCGSLIAIVSFYIGDPKLTRILSFPVSVCMLTYGASNGSVAAVINEILVMGSSVLGMLRNRKK